MKVLLTFAAVRANGLATWAYVVRESEKKIRNRFVHSASGIASPGTYEGAKYFALGFGLRYLVEAGRTGDELIVRSSHPDALVSITTPAIPAEPNTAKLRNRCVELFEAFASRKIEHIETADNPADDLARGAWESARLQSYPDRPTKRRKLPAFAKEGA